MSTRSDSCHVGLHTSSAIPVNKKHLYNICKMLDQLRGRCADVVQMLNKCVVFTGIPSNNKSKTRLFECLSDVEDGGTTLVFDPYNGEIFLYKLWRPKIFQFEIITHVLLTSFRFIWIPMLWVYAHALQA